MNRNRKRIITLICLAGLTASAWADSFKSLVISKADSTTLGVNLSMSMVTTMEGGNLVITDTGIDIRIPLADVRGWTYSTSAASGIADVRPDAGITLTRRGGLIIVSNLPSGADVAIYDVAGRLLRRFNADGGEVQFAASDLPCGTPLLLRAAGESLKLLLN